MSSPRIELEYFHHFLNDRKKYLKNNPRRLSEYKKTIALFLSNPAHPSLNLERLINTKGVYTIRLNRSDRIFFIWKDANVALLIDIGKHDKYRKY